MWSFSRRTGDIGQGAIAVHPNDDWDPDHDLPPGFPRGGFPRPQGPYYCSVGAMNAYGREIIEEHLDLCLEAGLNVEGINGEVAAGQWEFHR